MKKLVLMMMAIALLLGSIQTAALADSAETIAALTQIVEQTLKDKGYRYTYDAEEDLFDLEFSLDSSLSSAGVTIYIYDDMVSISVYSPLTVQPDHRDKMAKFLTLVNNNIYYGQFRMNYESGSVSCRSCQIVEEVLPGTREISVLLEMPLQYIDDYGDGIAQISIGGADPDAAFQAALDNQN